MLSLKTEKQSQSRIPSPVLSKMAEISAGVPLQGDQVPTKRSRSRRVLKEKNPSTNEANVLAKKVCESSTPAVSMESESRKENHQSASQPQPHSSPKRGKAASKKQSKQSFEKDLLEMQEKLQQLRLEKEKTEELLKAKDEMLKQKDEELDERGREQEKLQMELKKLQKLKEFKPTMVSFSPFIFYFSFLIFLVKRSFSFIWF